MITIVELILVLSFFMRQAEKEEGSFVLNERTFFECKRNKFNQKSLREL